MALCAHRPESPAFFTPCLDCPCAAEVVAELEAQAVPA